MSYFLTLCVREKMDNVAIYPFDENDRLEALRNLDLMETPNEERFDRITRLCTEIFQIQYAAINILDSDTQWGKSTCGMERDGVNAPREEAICNHTINQQGVMVIENTRTHEKTKNLKTVTGELELGFYAGHPIYSPENLPIGTLCVFGSEPRTFSEREKRILKDLASIVEGEIQKGPSRETYEKLLQDYKKSKRRAEIDDLCQIWDRGAIMELLEREISRADREEEPLSVGLLDLDHFKKVNDKYGHQTGDDVLRTFVKRVQQDLRDYDHFGRYGGEEFLFALVNTEKDVARRIAERIRTAVAETPFQQEDQEIPLTTSIGIVSAAPGDLPDLNTFIAEADENLYRAKENGRNEVVLTDVDSD